jgi:glutamate--cysteine ligase
VAYALFANSPLLEGKPSGFLSTRGEIWSRTDNDRCGLIEELLTPDAGLNDFVEYALDVPLYFIERNKQYVDMTASRFTFRQFLDGGWNGERATLKDWNLHLSTLFPEVRLRPQIEVRSADSLPPRFTPAVAALYKGLLYSEEALSGAEALLLSIAPNEFTDLYRRSWRDGLKAECAGGTFGEMIAELLKLARTSLQQQFAGAFSGADESHFLDPLEELVSDQETLAERLLKRWPASRKEQLTLLVEHCGYSAK